MGLLGPLGPVVDAFHGRFERTASLADLRDQCLQRLRAGRRGQTGLPLGFVLNRRVRFARLNFGTLVPRAESPLVRVRRDTVCRLKEPLN